MASGFISHHGMNRARWMSFSFGFRGFEHPQMRKPTGSIRLSGWADGSRIRRMPPSVPIEVRMYDGGGSVGVGVCVA